MTVRELIKQLIQSDHLDDEVVIRCESNTYTAHHIDWIRPRDHRDRPYTVITGDGRDDIALEQIW